MFKFNATDEWFKKAAENEADYDISAGLKLVADPKNNKDNNNMEKDESTYKVPLTIIVDIMVHPNADRLEVAKVYDFNVIVQKGQYKVGDRVIYIPIDSILSQEVEDKLFSPDAKIKLTKHRVKQIKIRKVYSQGMLADPSLLLLNASRYETEIDLATTLGITKYISPQAAYQSEQGQKKRNKPKENPYFHKYGGLDNFKWFPDLFKEGEEVSITEKIHGSHIRCGWVPYAPNTLWRKFKKLIGLAPTHEFCYGSNNVQLQQRSGNKGFYGEDVYGAALKKAGIKDKLKPGETLHGELYGDGIQKGYNYGLTNGEHKLVWFDLRIQTINLSDYVSAVAFQTFCKERELDAVPELYRGPFNKDAAKKLTEGDSVFVPSQKIREGVVIKPLAEEHCSIGRKVLKIISEKYLEGDQTDYH